MFKKIGEVYNKIKDNKGGVISLIGVSLIILALSAAIYVVGDFFVNDPENDSSIRSWDYGYTSNADSVSGKELRVANIQNPIVTESSIKKENLYLTRTFEPMKKSKTLVILTDHSPIKISVNGKEVYNNQFDSAQYVGNCYNAIRLEASEREQEVEIFMKVPLSVRFEASYSDSENTAFVINPALIAGIALLFLGFCALIFFAFLSLKNHMRYRSLLASLLMMYTGIAVSIGNISDSTYMFNAPFWLSVKTTAVHLTLVFGVACLARRLLISKKSLVIFGLTTLVVLLAGAASVVPSLFFIAEIVIAAVTVVYAAYTAISFVPYVTERTMYAIPTYVLGVYYTFVSLIAGLLLIFRSNSYYAFAVSFPTLVIVGMLEFINIMDYNYARKNSDINDEISRYSESVNNISEFIRRMLVCGDSDVFFDTAAREISGLLKKYNSENSDLRFCVAVKNENGFKEIINNNISLCRYEMIEKNCLKNNKDCMFSETYFDFVLKNDSGVCAVMHFENVVNGLEVFFISMIETVYCGLETAFQKLCDDGNNRLDIIFTELAENTEIDNGYSPDHLIHIAEYVFALCRRLGMSEEDAERYSLASKLHDIGKIAIPKSIINKEGRLTKDEQVVVSCHTDFGYIILSAFSDDKLLSDAAVIAKYHHERFDGTGSNGIKGEEIPLIARITMVCDVYDALVSERSYKRAWSKERAQSFMVENSGIMFDPKLVNVFLEYLNENNTEAQEAL